MVRVNKSEEIKSRIIDKLNFLYGEEKSNEIFEDIIKLIERYKDNIKNKTDKEWVNEEDVFLITYGDNIKKEGKGALKTLHEFLNKYLKGIITNVHILPFYPYSSDDGFLI